MFTEEKKKLLALEEKMRLHVSKQWSHLRSSIKQPFLVHPIYWGHKTRSLRRPRHHAGSTPPLYSQRVLPQHVPPPRVQSQQQLPPRSQQMPTRPAYRPPCDQNQDEYTNKSVILTNYEDGDWQVEVSEDEDTSSEISSLDIGVSREIVAEVHAPDYEPMYQGSTDSPTTGIEGIIYGDDVSPVSPYVESDEDTYPDVGDAMTAHPPPFFTITEAREVLATQGHAVTGNEGISELLNQVEYADVDDACSEFEADDEPEFEVDDEPTDANVQTTGYLSEFQAFYANYEEGADHLYYREDDGDDHDDEDDFEEDGD